MPTISELKDLAQIRLEEAKALFNSGLYDGCCYLAGYVVELSLKACICRTLDLEDYPEQGEISKSFKIHNLDLLLKLSGLERKFEKEKTNNQTLLTNWSLITEWSEGWRYKPIGTNPKLRAESIISSLEDEPNGVFTWLKKHW
ncbi:MAG: HEPN domain-containing protein [Deltaproteobacteria bacterium]|nr:HEPN domain-containing protein [Deltaproteobacteria bacterium]